MFRHVDSPDQDGAPGCWSGGEPSLPADIPWPMQKGGIAAEHAHLNWKDAPKIDYPYMFLLQVNCAEIPILPDEPEGTPHEGTLFVFFDGACGEGIQQFSDDVVRMIYVPEDCSSLPPRECPEMPLIAEQIKSIHYPGKSNYGRIPFVPLLSYEFKADFALFNVPPEKSRDSEWARYMSRRKLLVEAERDRIRLRDQNHHFWLHSAWDFEGEDMVEFLTISSEQRKEKLFGFKIGDAHGLRIILDPESLAEDDFSYQFVRRV